MTEITGEDGKRSGSDLDETFYARRTPKNIVGTYLFRSDLRPNLRSNFHQNLCPKLETWLGRRFGYRFWYKFGPWLEWRLGWSFGWQKYLCTMFGCSSDLQSFIRMGTGPFTTCPSQYRMHALPEFTVGVRIIASTIPRYSLRVNAFIHYVPRVMAINKHLQKTHRIFWDNFLKHQGESHSGIMDTLIVISIVNNNF